MVFEQYADHVPPKKEYDEEEMEGALKELALQLLRSRDGKIRGLRRKGEQRSLQEGGEREIVGGGGGECMKE